MFTGIKIAINKIRFRRINPHNAVFAVNVFDHNRVSVGNYSYGGVLCLNHNDTARVNIGHFVSIGPDVAFIPASDHRTGTVSTFPYKTKLLTGESEAISKGDINIEDDVWLGYDSKILSGVTVGQGAVIAAGAVVSGDIPPYAVAAGVPARVIKYRFEKDIIDYLLTLDYSKLTEEMVREHEEVLYTTLDGLGLDEVMRLFDWFPKKQSCYPK